ncbi:hypothetical protein HPP92_004953 [Vanilla planifolia]|uniref:Uncharacterized protein n=1 Tax=Vanilla planifolia TaxID=51239 RepID=A0A835VAW0_VANPL|nr:hypothetical protein HPP92_004953 [Vanilla planifolia]
MSLPSPKKSSVKFARRTSSGRIVSLPRDEVDVGPELTSTSSGGTNDYMNYTVLLPPTPDNQPYTAVGSSSSKSDDLQSSNYGSDVASKRQGRRGLGSGDDVGVRGSSKMERRMSVMKTQNKSVLVRTQTGDFDHNRWLFESKGTYGIGNAFWPQDGGYDVDGGMSMSDFMDKPWKPLTRKIRVPAGILSPYR